MHKDQMPLSRVDLNLFTVFDAIFREGGITPASRRLHLSQPAVSHALARLRELLDDPLFERRGNDMVPTTLARSLAGTVSASLGDLARMLDRAGHFNPADSTRVFQIAMRAAQEAELLPLLLARAGEAAPRIGIASVRIDRRDLEDDLHNGDLDLAIDVALPLSAEIRRQRVASSPLVVLARQGHPAVDGRLDLATYLAQDHVLVTGRRRGTGHEDIALGRLGLSRQVRVRCQRHTTAAALVGRSQLLATMAHEQAALANRDSQNQVLPFPAEIPPMESFVYWHARSDEDAAACWFRRQVLAALGHDDTHTNTPADSAAASSMTDALD